MQYTQLLAADKKSSFPTWYKVVGSVVMALAVAGLIWWQFSSYGSSLGKVHEVWAGMSLVSSWYVWAICVILMVINWSAEAGKWHYLARRVTPLSFFEAFRGVLSGLSLNAVLPHFLGDYAGRISAVKHRHRFRLVGGLWIGHVTQMAITCFAGAYGLALFINYYFPHFPVVSIAVAGVAITLLSLALIMSSLPRFIRIFGRSKAGLFLKTAHQFDKSDWVVALAFSAARYICFSLQFLLLLNLLGLQLSLHLQIAGITWVYLIKSWAPAINIVADLGIREVAALAFFPLFGADPAIIVASGLSVWFLNLFVPGIIGAASLIRMPACR
ncbi:lysylphosphatidylglycerol synthase domain-containing protein [Roseivirga sp. BDSF3-8]|uniref:lysylphosphatidylglycerol synthase domain-containing protein n=1 Tax=Roseivirga sp. BDSF3-8 TaxID=3241598 RepID=UPI0035325F47